VKSFQSSRTKKKGHTAELDDVSEVKVEEAEEEGRGITAVSESGVSVTVDTCHRKKSIGCQTGQSGKTALRHRLYKEGEKRVDRMGAFSGVRTCCDEVEEAVPSAPFVPDGDFDNATYP
jgi:hypothetical protein